jgi:hypothetical protein
MCPCSRRLALPRLVLYRPIELFTAPLASSSMVGTSNGTSLPYPSSITPESLTTSELSGSELLNAGILNSRISQNSLTCKFNGFRTLRASCPLSPMLDRKQPVTRKRNAPCRRWNKRRCPNSNAAWLYQHICSKFSDRGHVVSECPAWLGNDPSPLSKHWMLCPKYARDFMWATNEPTRVTTALFSEFANPFPQPPLNEIRNYTAWSTIHSNSHVFRVTTPVRVDRFRSLLSMHPNRLLVDSASCVIVFCDLFFAQCDRGGYGCWDKQR